MNKNTLKVVLSVAIVIAIGGSYLFPSARQSVSETFGAFPSAEIISPFLSVNQVRHEYRRQGLATATTTPCAIKSPSATSTLILSTLQLTVATNTATTWTFASSTTAFATTSLYNTFTVAANKLGTLQGTTTPQGASAVGDDKQILPPNSFLVWGVAGTQPADTTLLKGYCQAEFVAV